MATIPTRKGFGKRFKIKLDTLATNWHTTHINHTRRNIMVTPILRGTFTSQKGTPLHYRMYYDKGGNNPFNGKVEKRGYRLSIQRHPNKFAAYQGLEDENGAARLFLHEVKRQSKKQAEFASSIITDELLQAIADHYGI